MVDRDHLGEAAELYALGSLGDLERVRVERHVQTCDACAARVGEAESTVLALIESHVPAPIESHVPAGATAPGRVPAFVRPARGAVGAVVAAAVAAAIVAFSATTLYDRSARDDRVQTVASAMLAGHFAHAPFVAKQPGAPAAKVVYALEGGWLYVLVAPGPEPLTVTVVQGARRRHVATLPRGDGVRSAFAEVPGRVDLVELVDRGVTIASAHPVYRSH